MVTTISTATVGNKAKPSGAAVACGRTAPAQAAPCSDCPGREACLPAVLPPSQWGMVNFKVCLRQRVRRGQILYRAGDCFEAVYALRSGSFKTHVVGEDGSDQMTAIHLPGEVVGMEGIAEGRHCSALMALQNGEVCGIPYAVLRQLGKELPSVQTWVHRQLGAQIVRNAEPITQLGIGGAERRLSVFLLSLSRRYAARGYSPREFSLNLTRQDIGSHLGMSMETVSRAFSRLQREGLVHLGRQRVRFTDMAGLQRWAGEPTVACASGRRAA